MQYRLLAIVCVSVLSACSMAPDYQRPALPVDNIFPTEDALSGPSNQAYKTGWREFFQDPRLQQYIHLAIENNKDLRIAALRIEEAQANFGITRSERLPTLGIDAQSSRSLQSGNDQPFSRYRVNAAVTGFELDFFGRVKSLSDAALNQYLATEEAQRSAHIAIVAQVARAYISKRLAFEQKQVAEDTLLNNQASYDLIAQQLKAGIASELDLKQAETQVHAAKVQIAILERQYNQAQNALHELIGAKPNLLAKALPLREQNLDQNLSPGLPSEVLLNRPDIIAAEHSLQASNANIGAARAAFFPRITLTTAIGSESSDLSDLFSSGFKTWSFVPNLTLPIFDYGNRRANLDLAHVRKNIAVVNYEKSIQTAFREVADALVAKKPLVEQIQAQSDLLSAEEERLRLATLRYDSGIASYLDVLDAQRTLFSARQNMLSAYREQLINAINLYSALGGGEIETHDQDNVKQNSQKKEG